MKSIKLCSGTMVLLVFLFHSHVLIAKESLKIKPGDTLAEIQIPAPDNETHRKYPGLQNEGSFGIRDIKAEVVIIQLYKWSCTHCRDEAPTVNKLYRYLKKYRKTKGKVKLIGIAVGNDIHYVKLFREQYKVRFPLFPDEDLIINDQLGAKFTPTFISVKLGDDGTCKVFHTLVGPVNHAYKFLNKIVQESGLEK